MLIAIDFDQTIAKTHYPKIIEPIPGAIQTIEQLFFREHRLILWTLREKEFLNQAIEWLDKQDILKYFYTINQNCTQEIKKYNADPRKVAADLYIDDRGIGWQGWKQVRDYFCLG